MIWAPLLAAWRTRSVMRATLVAISSENAVCRAATVTFDIGGILRSLARSARAARRCRIMHTTSVVASGPPAPPPAASPDQWCVVANVKAEAYGRATSPGTRHFSAGAKLWVLPSQWDG